MTCIRWRPVAMVLLVTSMGVSTLTAQANTYKARLSPVPVDATTQAATTGTGSITATLRGTRLSIEGTFSGLGAPATVAKVHVAPRGMRGPAVLDVTVSPATSGTIKAELSLSAAQVDHLKRGRLYVQVHSEAAPDGNLWGWLLQ